MKVFAIFLHGTDCIIYSNAVTVLELKPWLRIHIYTANV